MIVLAKHIFKLGGKTIEYSILRSKRIRTSEIIVDENSVMIRTPMDKPISEIESIIKKKKNRIAKKQSEYGKRKYHITKPTFEADSTLPYLGKNYPLEINKNQSRNVLTFAHGQFVVYITSHRIDEDARSLMKHLYEEWIIRNANRIFKSKVKIYSQKLGVHVQKIMVKSNLKSRWASLTKKRSINFNMHLIKAPHDVIDYIVLHEICHLKIKGHSHHYWDLVYQYMPNYQDKIRWLNTNGRMIVNDIEMGIIIL